MSASSSIGIWFEIAKARNISTPPNHQFALSFVWGWGCQEFADYLIVLISFVFYDSSGSSLSRIPRVALALLLGHLYSLYLRQSFTCPFNMPFWLTCKLIISLAFDSRFKWMSFYIFKACANYKYANFFFLSGRLQKYQLLKFWFLRKINMSKHV